MTRSILIAGGSTSALLTNNRFWPVIGGPLTTVVASEPASIQFKTHIAGTFSKLGVRSASIGVGVTATFRKNGGNGNQVAALTTAWAEDAVHTDAVVDNDLIDIGFATSSTSNTGVRARLVFEAASGHVSFLGSSNVAGTAIASGTKYMSLCGPSIGQATEATAQLKVRAPGTYSKLFVYVSANSSGTTTTFAFRINGGNGNQTIAVGAGATGVFEDTTNTDAVVDDDLIDIAVTGHNNNITVTMAVATFTNIESPARNDIGVSRAASTASFPSTVPIGAASVGAESNAQIPHGFPGRCSNLRIHVSANTRNGTTTYRVLKPGTGNQVVAVPAGSTGWFEDTTHSDYFGADDFVDIGVTYGGSSGNITPDTIALTEAAEILGTITDTLTCSDVTSGFLHPALSGVVADSLVTSDIFHSVVSPPITAGRTDTLATSETRGVTASYNLSRADGVVLSDSYHATRVFAGDASVSDQTAAVDVHHAVLAAAIHVSVTDALTLVEVVHGSTRPTMPTWQAIGERRETLFPN